MRHALLFVLQEDYRYGYEYYSDLSNFLIEKKIGRGQFSEVYRATCLLDNRQVALKKVQVNIYINSNCILKFYSHMICSLQYVY